MEMKSVGEGEGTLCFELGLVQVVPLARNLSRTILTYFYLPICWAVRAMRSPMPMV